MICSHGIEWHCKQCSAENEKREKESVKNGECFYGVFAWTGQNDYYVNPAKAVLLFKSKKLAQKFADKENANPLKICREGYVVRLTKNNNPLGGAK